MITNNGTVKDERIIRRNRLFLNLSARSNILTFAWDGGVDCFGSFLDGTAVTFSLLKRPELFFSARRKWRMQMRGMWHFQSSHMLILIHRRKNVKLYFLTRRNIIFIKCSLHASALDETFGILNKWSHWFLVLLAFGNLCRLILVLVELLLNKNYYQIQSDWHMDELATHVQLMPQYSLIRTTEYTTWTAAFTFFLFRCITRISRIIVPIRQVVWKTTIPVTSTGIVLMVDSSLLRTIIWKFTNFLELFDKIR